MDAYLKRYKFNGKTFFGIIDGTSCPVDPYASAYLSTLTHYELSTQARYVNELLFALKYFDSKDIRLTERVAAGALLTMSEYTSFHRESAISARRNAGYNKRIPQFVTSEDKTFRNILVSNAFITARVSNGTQRGRINRLRNYLTWLFEQFHDTCAVDGHLQDRLNKLTKKMHEDERSLIDDDDQGTRHPEDDAIPPEIFCRLLEIVRPSSPNNPFTYRNRLRNFLIVYLFLDTGIRRGALAKLKVSDLRSNRSGASLWIYPNSDDASDPRLERPNQKTKAHLAHVKSEIMDALLFYIEHVRNGIPESASHDFVFVSESNAKRTRGQPLAAKSFNEVFRILSRVLSHRLHPHLLRHMWNDLFDDKADHHNFTSQQIEDARKYAMGWSAKSTMADTYNDRRTHQKVRKIMKEHQDRMD